MKISGDSVLGTETHRFDLDTQREIAKVEKAVVYYIAFKSHMK